MKKNRLAAILLVTTLSFGFGCPLTLDPDGETAEAARLAALARSLPTPLPPPNGSQPDGGQDGQMDQPGPAQGEAP